MLRLIRFLITGDYHLHKWETFDTETVYPAYGTPETTLPKGEKYHLRCSVCGNLKFKKSY